MTHADVAVLIPAYKPDEHMNVFIRQLRDEGFVRIVAVDDGGGPEYGRFFEQAERDGAQVLTHEVNRGKGAALRTGLSAIAEGGAMPVITADCDGQHSPGDVSRMAEVLLDSPDSLILGTRDKALMPPRSKAGNTITCVALGMLTGLWVQDTQTGLRGLPKNSLGDFIQLDGDRYEYEMNMLILARQKSMPVVQMKIDTIYYDSNKGSHFDTFRDSYRIYSLLFKQIGRYIGSSMVSGLVEYTLFFVMLASVPNHLWLQVIVPRIVSAGVSYIVNREMVFKSRAGKRSIMYFYLLVAMVLCINYGLIYWLTSMGVATYIAKPIVDFLLFVLSYNVQQRVIFRDRISE